MRARSRGGGVILSLMAEAVKNEFEAEETYKTTDYLAPKV
jgi:hypothetical protein